MAKINGFLAVAFWGSPWFICGAAGATQGISGWLGGHSTVSEFRSAFILYMLGLGYDFI